MTSLRLDQRRLGPFRFYPSDPVVSTYEITLPAGSKLVSKPADLHPNVGVIPYDLNSPLFSDYAAKSRFVWMPPGTSASYHDTESFDFPAGTTSARPSIVTLRSRRRR